MNLNDRERYEEWFRIEYGQEPMPRTSPTHDFCWAGYKAGAAFNQKEIVQQLEQAHADIAGLHDQLEEPQIVQDDYRLNKLELEQLRQQLAELEKQNEELMIELCHRSTK